MPRRLTALIAFTLLTAVGPAAAAIPAIQLVPVLVGLSAPVYVTSARDGTDRLFVVEQTGRIKVVGPGETTPRTFLDLRAKVLSSGERGLLGLAFHPRIESARRFVMSYTRRNDGAVVIAEFRVSTRDPNVADPTETVLLVIPKPFANHNGGMVEFGPDGFLYIGIGDGGGANDPDRRAQDVTQLLGKILRIDVDTPGLTGPYSAPPSNPFFGAAVGADEIFAYGLRNPWRFSFDRETGELFVGDVGQRAVEEIDLLTVGDNAGWRVWEASRCTNLEPALCDPHGFVFPIAEYRRTGGRCAVTGGYVYRGQRGSLPAGSYVYGDFCSGEIFVLDGGVSSIALNTVLRIASFGEDEAGEIHVVDHRGTIFRIAGGTLPGSPQLTLSFDGRLQDRVGAGTAALAADGALDGTLTLTVNGSAGRTLTALRLQSSGAGAWDTGSGTAAGLLGVARSATGPLVNQPGTMAIALVPEEGESFTLFAADPQRVRLAPGRTLTVTATFTGGRTATATAVVPSEVGASRLTLTFDGRFQDRVGAGNTALAPDGDLDGTLRLMVSGTAGRTLTGLRLQSSGTGAWDTRRATTSAVLGVARSQTGTLLNDVGTMGITLVPGDGETLTLFAADPRGIHFLAGRPLILTATFTGGLTLTARTTVP
jgi:hypothetical protein